MKEHVYTFRVQYPETDQMGTVHHANYVKYYETARWEFFRSLGIPYRELEDEGYMLPVTNMSFRFLKTTHYDALLTVKTSIKVFKGVRLRLEYKLYNEKQELINVAETELAFVRKGSWKPCAPPQYLVQAIEMYLGSVG